MSLATVPASVSQRVQGDSALLLFLLTGSAGPQRIVDCFRSAAFAPAGRTVVYVPAIRARGRRFVPSIP